MILPLLLISYLTFKTALGRVEDANSHLRELNRLYLSTIETLAMAIDAKDQITHGHIRRVQSYAVKLARAVGITDARQIQAIEAAALLHDMGKLAVPEYILNKPGPLTPAEFDKMKLHASVGADILSAIDFPYPVVPIVRHHHENWDGTGYPAGLSGSDIPIGARILSVVDCFDALTSDRPYRPRLSDDDAIKILLARRGNMYDPLAVDTFIRLHSELADSVEELDSDSLGLLSPIGHGHQGRELDRTQTTLQLDQIAATRIESLGLLEFAQDLATSQTPQSVADIALKHLRRLVPAPTAVVFVKEDNCDELAVLSAAGDHAAGVSSVRIRVGQRLTGWVGANRQTIRNSDPMLDLGEYARSMKPPLKAALSSPICVGDELVGVISVYGTVTDSFSLDHQRIIETLALQLARPLQAAVAHSKRLSPIVSLTEPTGPTALLYVALFPLETQDQLRWVSSQQNLIDSIRLCLRPADDVSQIADGEFAVSIASVRVQAVGEIINRIADSLEKWRNLQPQEVQLTSAVAISPTDGANRHELLAAARAKIATNRTSRSSASGESIH